MLINRDWNVLIHLVTLFTTLSHRARGGGGGCSSFGHLSAAAAAAAVRDIARVGVRHT